MPAARAPHPSLRRGALPIRLVMSPPAAPPPIGAPSQIAAPPPIGARRRVQLAARTPDVAIRRSGSRPSIARQALPTRDG